MSLERVRFADLAALPSRDEIRARRAAEKAAKVTSVERSDNGNIESIRTESLRSDPLPIESLRSKIDGSELLRSEAVRSDSLYSVPLASYTPIVDVPGTGKRRYYHCSLVQDGHTAGEDRLFNTMVRLVKRKGQFLSDGSWLLSVSMDDLAEAAAMHRTNVRNNLKGLVAKLAIEQTQERNMHQLVPRTYHGFTFRQILERRKMAGMEWVVRSRGVVFVPTSEAEKALRSESLRSASSSETESLRIEPLPSDGSESRPALRSESLPPSLLVKDSLERTSSSDTSPLVSNAIMNVFGMIDDDAVALLIRKCRENAADATDEEIAELAAFQCRRILRMRNVDNPIGLIIQQLPKCFEGEALARYRRERAEQDERFDQLYDPTSNEGGDTRRGQGSDQG